MPKFIVLIAALVSIFSFILSLFLYFKTKLLKDKNGINISVLRPKFLIVIIILFVGFFVLTITSLSSFNIQEESKYTPTAEIQFPKTLQTVKNSFYAQGTMKNIPDSSHIWIGVQINDLYWPKVEIKRSQSIWYRDIQHYGNKGEIFYLIVMMVDKKTHYSIINWLSEGNKSGSYPGITLKNCTVLDLVKLKLED